ncbi:MAG: hypothetical protein OXC41_08230 [Gammaproteobacteria bacterium]|nr:hypothetical protein [Gammaproteobacteria bacterium]
MPHKVSSKALSSNPESGQSLSVSESLAAMEVCYHDYANPLQWLCKSHDNTDAILFDHFTNDVTIRAFLDVLAENFGGFGG